MIYCQLKISSQAIKLLIKTKGAIPNSFMQSLNDNMKLTNQVDQLTNKVDQFTNEVDHLTNEIAQLID